MEGVYAALIALASAVLVKLLDWIFSRRDRKDKALEEIKAGIAKNTKGLDELREEVRENQAIMCRQSILRFSDDLMHDQEHSREYYDVILQDITEYDLFCDRHPGFKNAVTGQAAKNILKHYESHMWQKDFL